MSQDRKLDALEQIEKRQKDQISIFRDKKDRFSEFTEGLYGERLTENEYLKLLQMFYQRAVLDEENRMKPGSRKARRQYCLMQMKRLEKSRKAGKLKKFYPFLMPSDEKVPELESFLAKHEDLYSQEEAKIIRVFLWAATLVSLGLLALCTLVLKCSFLPGLIVILLLDGAFLVYAVQVLAPELTNQQMHKLVPSLEKLHLGLEKALPKRPGKA